MSFDVEVGFISKLLETKDIMPVKDSQIKITYLTGNNKLAYNYIYDSILNTGEVPTVRAFQRQFPSYELETYEKEGKEVVGTEESILYWCSELRTKVKHNKLAESMDSVAENLQDFKTDEAYTLIKKTIAYIESEVLESSDVDLTDTDGRKQAYLDRKVNKGITGIPTGFSKLDYILKGLGKETLTTVIANTGIGKAVVLDTPVLTPKGFVPMRDIKVGSKVISEDGLPYKVSAVYPHKDLEVYRVTFEDGSYVDCCKDHLWKFKTIDDVYRKKEWRVKSVEQILNDHPIKRGRTFNICIPVGSPVEFPLEEENKIHPYVLGCLLGDGGFTTDRITFTNPEKDLLHKLNSILKPYGEFTKHKGTDCQYCFKSSFLNCNYLYRWITELGLNKTYSNNKFIPRSYLMASVPDRVKLLEGLIDTDGHVTSKGHILFSTSSPQLCKDFMYLCRSLGFRCNSSTYDREDKGTEYRVSISSDKPLFSSEKHSKIYNNRTVAKRVNHYNHLKMVSIEKLSIKQDMQCITVDSPDHTFICGDFIVTHNTWLEVLIGAHCQLAEYKVLQFVTEMSEQVMRDRYEAVLYAMCYGDLNYNQFKSGSLDLKTERSYFRFLDEDLPQFESLIIATATGVMGISADIDKYDPDIVLIDGVYLMEDDQGAKDDWLRVAHITRDLKKLAKRAKKPILINTQADKNTSKKTGPELGSIMYTQAVGQDSDNVIAMFRDELMLNDDEMGIKVLKQREGSLGKVMLNWDFNRMNFKEIYSETGSQQEFDDEEENNTGKSTGDIKDNTLDVL